VSTSVLCCDVLRQAPGRFDSARVNLSPGVMCLTSMQFLEEVDSGTIERLKEQEEFLLRIHQAEFSKDPTSRATESSRSNLVALRHTLKQMYGEAVAWDAAKLISS
jgi:hypothetical protein